jgi:hypothetical protein
VNDVDSSEAVERVVTQCCVSVRLSNGLIFYNIYCNVIHFPSFSDVASKFGLRLFNRYFVVKVEVII